MALWHAVYAREQCPAHGQMSGLVNRERFAVPSRRYAKSKERLDLGRHIKDVPDLGIIKRLDTKAIPNGPKALVRTVPKYKSKLPAQARKHLCPKAAVEGCEYGAV